MFASARCLLDSAGQQVEALNTEDSRHENIFFDIELDATSQKRTPISSILLILRCIWRQLLVTYTMTTPAAFFKPPGSKYENMLFDDPVFAGYIPANPAPTFTMPKSILEMSAAEKEQKLAEFAQEQKAAMVAEAQNILTGKSTTNPMHGKLLVALYRGDEYFAERLIIRGK